LLWIIRYIAVNNPQHTMKKINHKRCLWVLVFVSVQCCTNSLFAQNAANSFYNAAIDTFGIDRNVAISLFKESIEVRLNRPFEEPDKINNARQFIGEVSSISIDSIAKTYRNIGICYLGNTHPTKAIDYLSFSVDLYSLSALS